MALRACKECGGQVSSKAKTCPHCGAPVSQETGFGCLLLLGMAGFCLIGGVWMIPFDGLKTAPSPTGRAQERSGPEDDFAKFIRELGRPDEVDSTENDSPRPPLVTKWIVYRKAKVRITFLPDAPVGSPPPYRRWKVMALQDSETLEPLTSEEVQRRIRHDDREKPPGTVRRNPEKTQPPPSGNRIPNNLATFLVAYGSPDKVLSSGSDGASDTPPTKDLVYMRENVRVTFSAQSDPSIPVSDDLWILNGAQDATTDEDLLPTELLSRLQKRRR